MDDWLTPAVIITVVGLVIAVIGLATALFVHVFKIGRWTGKIETEISSLQEDMSWVKSKIDAIQQDIKGLLSRMPPATVTRTSPLRLTELGEEISAEVGAKEWAEQAAEAFRESAEGMEPFEIQILSFEFVKKEFKPESYFLRILQAGAYSSEIDLDKVYDVLAVELRDRLLQIMRASNT